jgi:hypothetical protein
MPALKVLMLEAGAYFDPQKIHNNLNGHGSRHAVVQVLPGLLAILTPLTAAGN